MESKKTNNALLLVIAICLAVCSFFMYDNYRDKQNIKAVIIRAAEIAEEEILDEEYISTIDMEQLLKEAEEALRKEEEK